LLQTGVSEARGARIVLDRPRQKPSLCGQNLSETCIFRGARK